MGTIADKLTYTQVCCEEIRQAVKSKNPNFDVDSDIGDIPQAIMDISGGGGGSQTINFFDWTVTNLGQSAVGNAMTGFDTIDLTDSIENYDLLVFVVGVFTSQDKRTEYLYDRAAQQGILAVITPDKFFNHSLSNPIVCNNANITGQGVGTTFNISFAFRGTRGAYWKNEGAFNRYLSIIGLSKKKNERHDTILDKTLISSNTAYIIGQKFNFSPMDYDVLMFETEQNNTMYYNASAPMLSSSMYVTPQNKTNPVRITIDNEKIVSVNYSGSYINTYLTIRGIKFNSEVNE